MFLSGRPFLGIGRFAFILLWVLFTGKMVGQGRVALTNFSGSPFLPDFAAPVKDFRGNPLQAEAGFGVRLGWSDGRPIDGNGFTPILGNGLFVLSGAIDGMSAGETAKVVVLVVGITDPTIVLAASSPISLVLFEPEEIDGRLSVSSSDVTVVKEEVVVDKGGIQLLSAYWAPRFILDSAELRCFPRTLVLVDPDPINDKGCECIPKPDWAFELDWVRLDGGQLELRWFRHRDLTLFRSNDLSGEGGVAVLAEGIDPQTDKHYLRVDLTTGEGYFWVADVSQISE